MTKNHCRLCFHTPSVVPRRCKGFVLTHFHTIRRTCLLPFLPVDVPPWAIGGCWLSYFSRRSQTDEVCVPTAPSSWCFLKSEAVMGHFWLCPCLRHFLRWFTQEVVVMPPFLSEPLYPLEHQIHPLYQHAPLWRCHWVSSCSYGTVLFSERWVGFSCD